VSHGGAKGEAEEATIEEWGVLVVTFHTQMRGSMRETIAQFQKMRGDIFSPTKFNLHGK